MESAAELYQKFETHQAGILLAEKWKSPLYAPAAYILSLGGKRVRPLLAMLAYQAASEKTGSSALNLAVAVEMFHNFTLVHDDIMDAAPVRRGKQTVHEKWGLNTAILSGDAMFAISMEMLVMDFPEHAAKLAIEFSRMAAGVCEGQSEDMELQGRLGVSIDDYLEMIRKKTALLIGSSLQLGAIAAGADEKTCSAFNRWGVSAGMGFQLRDDYLDAFGDEKRIGKQAGGDILQNKMTFLVLKAWANAGESQRENLKRLLFEEKDPMVKVSGVLHLFVETGAKAAIEAEMMQQFEKADAAGNELAHLNGTGEIQKLFAELKTRES